MGLEFAHDFHVGEFLEPIGGDVLIVDYEEGVGVFYSRSCARGSGINALTQAA